jgi:hypothetical protein
MVGGIWRWKIGVEKSPNKKQNSKREKKKIRQKVIRYILAKFDKIISIRRTFFFTDMYQHSSISFLLQIVNRKSKIVNPKSYISNLKPFTKSSVLRINFKRFNIFYTLSTKNNFNVVVNFLM